MQVTTRPTATLRIKIRPPLKIVPGTPKGITDSASKAPVKKE